MHLTQLSLTNFRNYASQELSFEAAPVLLLGENAQGKTNLLEAVFLLATGRSERASIDADLIAWDARDDVQPVARVAGRAQRQSGDAPVAVNVEVLIAGREGAHGLVASKKFRLNGVARRASDVIGAITAVLFTTDDMELVKGPPAGRRRYLDIMLSQADRAYVRALSHYNKVVTQRNALLKRVQEGAAKRDELAYWDEELARDGAGLLSARAAALAELAPAATASHGRLSGEREDFAVAYQPRFSEDWPSERIAQSDVSDVEAALLDRLQSTYARDIGAGITLVGPHRDDMSMTLGGEPAAHFASRGQQRTAALALRLAEARFLRDRSGEQPVLLLDDVLSELDESRRASVLEAIESEQVFITSPDPDRFSERFVASAQCFRVEAGRAEPL
jgi:DNA replication and repair protein RecF